MKKKAQNNTAQRSRLRIYDGAFSIFLPPELIFNFFSPLENSEVFLFSLRVNHSLIFIPASTREREKSEKKWKKEKTEKTEKGIGKKREERRLNRKRSRHLGHTALPPLISSIFFFVHPHLTQQWYGKLETTFVTLQLPLPFLPEMASARSLYVQLYMTRSVFKIFSLPKEKEIAWIACHYANWQVKKVWRNENKKDWRNALCVNFKELKSNDRNTNPLRLGYRRGQSNSSSDVCFHRFKCLQRQRRVKT